MLQEGRPLPILGGHMPLETLPAYLTSDIAQNKTCVKGLVRLSYFASTRFGNRYAQTNGNTATCDI